VEDFSYEEALPVDDAAFAVATVEDVGDAALAEEWED
jgi:hypothetical protein